MEVTILLKMAILCAGRDRLCPALRGVPCRVRPFWVDQFRGSRRTRLCRASHVRALHV